MKSHSQRSMDKSLSMRRLRGFMLVNVHQTTGTSIRTAKKYQASASEVVPSISKD